MFYKDGWYYADMMDMKIKQPMDTAAALAQVGTDDSGLSSYKVNHARGSMTIDPNGYFVQDNMIMDMEMTIVDPETGEVSDVKYVMDVSNDYKNLGQTVTLTFPSTEGYTDVTAQ